MKKGWQTKPIGKVATIKPPKSEARERVAADALVSFLPMEDLGIAIKYPEPKQAKKLSEVVGSYTYFAEDDVLLAKITPCFENGKLGVAKGLKNGIGFGSSEFIVLRPSGSVTSEWLFYFLSREDFRSEGAQRMGGAVGQQRVPKEFVEACQIPIPPLSEQHRIVGILDEAFDGLARALFESHLQSVFTQRGKGWGEKTVGEIAQHSLGKMLDKSKNKGEPQSYLRNINVRWFTFDLTNLLEMRFLEEEAGKYTAVKGDVLVCEGGYPGRAAIWGEDYPIHFQKALHRVRFYDPEHNKWFVYFLYAQDKSGELRRHFTGTGIQHFTGEVLSRFKIPIAPLHELRRLVSRFEELFEEAQRLESIYQQKLAALDELKKSLLHEAFTGKL